MTFIGREFKEIYFAGVAKRKGMVAFYFFPIYTHAKLADELGAPQVAAAIRARK